MRASGRSTLFTTSTTGRPGLERLAEHEAGLRERALGGVHEQHHPVHHRQAALDLAAEVGVARGVDEVELHVAVADRRVLGEDRDAALALLVHRVHDQVGEPLGLVGGEHAGLAQHRVDQRGLAVVDVGDDRDVADVRALGHRAPTLVMVTRGLIKTRPMPAASDIPPAPCIVGVPHSGAELLRRQLAGQLAPQARLIHVIRDGRDVAASLRGLPLRPGRRRNRGNCGQLARHDLAHQARRLGTSALPGGALRALGLRPRGRAS